MIAPNRAVAEPLAVLVVIVAYNAGEHLQRCVDALERQTFQDWRAVLWDNASSDGALDALRTGPRVEVVRCAENLGFAAANNRAAERAASHYIATLNPDAFPEPDWLERLVAAAKAHQAAAVGSLQIDDADPAILDGAGDCMSIAGVAWRGGYGQPRSVAPAEAVEIFSPCAAAALYRRDAFDALGGFEERFFCYYEDVDLGFRLRLAGGRCVLEPKAVVRHVGSASSDKVSGFAEYHGTRNRLWTFMRDMPTALLPIALPAHLLVTAYVMLRSPHLWTIRWSALRDAWRGRQAFLQERSSSPPPASLLRALTWSPTALSRRRLKAVPIKGR